MIIAFHFPTIVLEPLFEKYVQQAPAPKESNLQKMKELYCKLLKPPY
ncbi:hypothetical protein GYH30_032370 [Glycine max]|nr:hypothetical protein GYH30_032370 [Glycine max]